MGKRVIISVISDLVTDQRVHKVATTLQQNGFTVLVIGATKKISKPLPSRTYASQRIRMIFQSGFIRYAEWNIRLFFKLLFTKANIFLANDLDTLLPNFIVSKLSGKQLVYDSHEYFTEQEELQNRKLVKGIWNKLESFLVPRLTYCYTVNESIASIYKEKYHKNFLVLRNMPVLQQEQPESNNTAIATFSGKKILLTQGVGLHRNRGIEELIKSTKLLPDTFVLVIVGGGLALSEFKELVSKEQLEHKVHFMEVLPPDELRKITRSAFCGFSIDKPTCLNYVYSLPNKLFDFIHAGIPVIGSNLVEVARIITQYNVGLVIDTVSPEAIAAAIMQLEHNTALYETLRQNTQKAKIELCWEKDAGPIVQIFSSEDIPKN